jgi:serine/threonine protein kinase
MLCGKPPHYQPKNRKQMLKDIVGKPIEMKSYFSTEARSMLEQLLERNPEKRLGSSSVDADEIMQHPFFSKINWPDLRAGKVKPPYKPVVASAYDTRNIDTLFTNEKLKETPDESMTGSEKNKTNF